ncbi:hypothetical protein E2320_003556 [Naja naja]|nr:hypothetical protein E2320_003556 [Naja naja]
MERTRIKGRKEAEEEDVGRAAGLQVARGRGLPIEEGAEATWVAATDFCITPVPDNVRLSS